jgi:hypothetical protein
MTTQSLKTTFEEKIKEATPKELPRGPGKVGWDDSRINGQKKLHKPGRPKPEGPPPPKKTLSDLP